MTAPKVLQAWEYGDPADVVERRESERNAREASLVSRETAIREADVARRARQHPLSPVTARLVKQLRIRQLVKEVLGKRGA